MATTPSRMTPLRGSVALCVLVLATLATCTYGIQTKWMQWGGDIKNTRLSDHTCLDFSVGKFQKLWTFPTASSVYGTPTVCGDGVYFNDQSVVIYKLNATNGKLVWSKKAREDILPTETAVGIRVSPIMSPDCKTMYLASQWTTGAYIIALNTGDGSVKYKRKFDNHPLARVSQSGTLYNNVLYIGVSSMTEGKVTSKTDFQGAMYALNPADGTQKWRTVMCPPGYTGCGIWGSSPAIDSRRNQVCVGTGNNYEVPVAVAQCVKAAGSDFAKQRACAGEAGKQNYVDAIVCMDLTTGAVKFVKTMSGVDMYLPGAYMGVDEDFAQGVIIIHKANKSEDLLVGTSKGSRPIAIRRDTGKTVWSKTRLAPGGYAMWGSCTNNQAYCVGLFFFGSKTGRVFCLNVMTGAQISSYTSTDGSIYGPLTCTKRYVFIPKFDAPGSLVAMEIATGKVAATYATGATLFCGPAIVNGVAYMGSGYNYNGGSVGKTFHAVKLPLKGTC